MIKPVEFKVLLKVDAVEETTSGGIILPSNVKEREQVAQEKAEIVAVGGDAFSDWNEPIPKVGDRVLFEKYGGKIMADNEEFRIVNDKDIVAILED